MLYTKKLALTTKMKLLIQQQQQNCLIMHTNHIYAKTTTIFNKFPFTVMLLLLLLYFSKFFVYLLLLLSRLFIAFI